MNNYIHPENQKILWNTINKIQIFSYLPNNQKEELFKSVISLFYEKYKNTKLNNEQLKQLNKDTISIIIQHLKTNSLSNKQPISNTSNMDFTEGPTTTHIISKETTALHGTESQTFDNVFKRRLNDYEMMSAKPKPPMELDFSEKLNDEPITETNMSVIIQKHIKERENGINMDYQSGINKEKVQSLPIESKNELYSLKQQMEEMRKEMKEEIQLIKELLTQIKDKNGENNNKTIIDTMDTINKNHVNKDKEII